MPFEHQFASNLKPVVARKFIFNTCAINVQWINLENMAKNNFKNIRSKNLLAGVSWCQRKCNSYRERRKAESTQEQLWLQCQVVQRESLSHCSLCTRDVNQSQMINSLALWFSLPPPLSLGDRCTAALWQIENPRNKKLFYCKVSWACN